MQCLCRALVHQSHQSSRLGRNLQLVCRCTSPHELWAAQDRVLPDGTFIPAGSLHSQSTTDLQRHQVQPQRTIRLRQPGRASQAAAEPAADSLRNIEATGESTPPQPSHQGRRQPGVPPTAPAVDPVSQGELEQLVSFLQDHRDVAVLTGAGCSTESNIPDYRGPSGAYSSGFQPMTHQQFVSNKKSQARYWARSFAGWHEYCDVQPNAAHHALARLQGLGWVGPLVTQNVDRLHSRAGYRDVLELHGTTHRVICLSCGRASDRYEFQEQLKQLNPEAAAAVALLQKAGADKEAAARRMSKVGAADQQRARDAAKAGVAIRRPDGDVEWPVRRPDGDVELRDAGHGFHVPACSACGGDLKPDVVFFGDGVPKQRADRALEIASTCGALLVVGSSVQVYSAFRLVKAAHGQGTPVALLNAGPTRADALAQLHVHALAGEALARIASHPSMLLPPT